MIIDAYIEIIDECITPNIYKLIHKAIIDKEDGIYMKLILDLINKSTREECRLATLHNHYKRLIDPKNVDFKNEIHKVAIACFNSSTKIDTEVYMGINIYTTEAEDESYNLDITRKYLWQSKRWIEYKRSVEQKITNQDNQNPKLDTPIIENKVKIFSIDTTTKELNNQNIYNKPANPSNALDALNSENKMKKFTIDTTTKELNIEELNIINDLKNKSDNNLEAAQLAKKINILTFEMHKISNQPKQPSRFIELLITHSPYLANNINNILVKLEELVLYADAHSNELNEKMKILPYAQYQLIARFIRACAYKQAKLPCNKQEEDVLLKTEEKEFEIFRAKYRNLAYPGANARTIFKNNIESFLNGIPLDIDKLFEVYGMYI